MELRPKPTKKVKRISQATRKPTRSPASPDSATRKVPLHDAQLQIEQIEALLNQLDELVSLSPAEAENPDLSAEQVAEQLEQQQQSIAQELEALLQENVEYYQQAINRMLNRAAYETRQWVGQQAVAGYHRTQAGTLTLEVERHKRRIGAIKATIATSLQNRGERRFQTGQHKMHLSHSTSVRILEEQVPGLERLLALNAKYPGILGQLRFNESGRLIDVEFRPSVLKALLEAGDEETTHDLSFAVLQIRTYLVVPTISVNKAKQQVELLETGYGVELGW